MTVALRLYEQLSEATDDKTRARLIAEALGSLEERYPQLGEVATHAHGRESELRLQKEIEVVRKEIKQTEVHLLRGNRSPPPPLQILTEKQ